MSKQNMKLKKLSLKKYNLFKGTIILTLAGLLTRVLGFFYKIYLSNTMGAERLGIYQLIFPIYGICFTIYATGIQTSLSRLVAAEMGMKNYRNIRRILKTSLILSVTMALILSFLVYWNADYIAWRFLMEERTASSLRIMAIVFPFCGITSIINGYYYGIKKAGIPASTQLLEQFTRIIVVYLIALYSGNGDLSVTCELAVFGLVIGEIVSCLYNLVSLFFNLPSRKKVTIYSSDNSRVYSNKKITKDILQVSIPLSTNRLLINILHSVETVLIPTMLRRFGLSNAAALSTYGVLSGMSMPFIMFPTAMINALVVLLLPTISEAQALNNDKMIGKTASVTIKYSLIIGILSTGIFIIFGKDLGISVFHNEAAGSYLYVLAWLCPLIYLASTLGSILNGLGKVHITFANSISGTLSKIALIIILIPRYGIKGYLIALLVGQLVITLLDTYAVLKHVQLDFPVVDSLIKPGLTTALIGFLLRSTYIYIKKMIQMNDTFLILIFCLIFCIIYIGFLITTKAISKKDFY